MPSHLVLAIFITSSSPFPPRANSQTSVHHQHRIKSLALPDLSTLLWALAQLQLPPPDDILQDLIDATAVHISTSAHDGDGCDCDSTHLTNIVWALGRLQARPDREWLVAAQQASLKVTWVIVLCWCCS